MGRVLPSLVQVSDNVITPAFPRRGRKPKLSDDDLKGALARGLSDAAIAAEFKCSAALVYSKRSKLGLLRQRGAAKVIKSKSRFESKPVHKQAVMPPVDHAALSEGRTIYPSTVIDATGADRLLVSGENSWKIGSMITKGPCRGFPIYTLTLEERATCPDSCRHWRSCYGNHMHLARRLRHGPEFEDRLGHELAVLQYRHPRGFAVRLHVLGDFYSVEYVNLWVGFLEQFKAMLVFGFTARHSRKDPIAMALIDATMNNWPRFAIRFSNAPTDECSTVTVEHPRQVPEDAILCPQQIGKTRSCGTCGLCWHTKRRVAFLQH